MARYTNPLALLSHQQKLFAKVNEKARGMHLAAVRDNAKQATLLVSGTTSTAQLRNAGHPFARRKMSRRGYARTAEPGNRTSRMSEKLRMGAGQAFPLLPINRQSGRLRQSLRMKGEPSGIPHGQTLSLGFTAPYAKHILAKPGTKRMVARGYVQAMAKASKKRNNQLEAELRLMILQAAVTGRVR